MQVAVKREIDIYDLFCKDKDDVFPFDEDAIAEWLEDEINERLPNELEPVRVIAGGRSFRMVVEENPPRQLPDLDVRAYTASDVKRGLPKWLIKIFDDINVESFDLSNF